MFDHPQGTFSSFSIPSANQNAPNLVSYSISLSIVAFLWCGDVSSFVSYFFLAVLSVLLGFVNRVTVTSELMILRPVQVSFQTIPMVSFWITDSESVCRCYRYILKNNFCACTHYFALISTNIVLCLILCVLKLSAKTCILRCDYSE